MAKPSFRPPNPPWKALKAASQEGYVSIYYSDDLSRLPIRFVTKPGDNKSDPNLETKTYGLFSTCSPSLRSGLVNRRIPYIFFATRIGDSRFLAGFYEIGWYATAFSPRANDYALAAKRVHFVAKPVPFDKVDKHCKTDLSQPFRAMRLLSEQQCACLRALLEEQPDSTADYLKEIDRLENFSESHTCYRYSSWRKKEGFTWDAAEKYLASEAMQTKRTVNESPSGKWNCSSCGAIIKNKALLRECPECKSMGTLSAKE